MAQRRRRRTIARCVEEYGDKEIVIPAIHDASVKLAHFNKWVKGLNGKSGPDGMYAVREKDRPVSGRLPNWEDDDATKRR